MASSAPPELQAVLATALERAATKDIHSRTPTEVAVQIWCEPQHSHKEMDVHFAQSIATQIEREQHHTDAWFETAAQHHRNEEYYRGLCDQIGEAIGEDAYIQDDGGRSEEVLRAKLPELVRSLAARLR